MRVTRLVLDELERTPVHAHDRDELVVTIRGSVVRTRDPGGRLRNEEATESGDVYFFPTGREPHYIENCGVGPAVFVTVELKSEPIEPRTGSPAKA